MLLHNLNFPLTYYFAENIFILAHCAQCKCFCQWIFRKIYIFKISIDTIKLMSNKAGTIYTHTHSVAVALYLYKTDINLLSFCDV